MALLTALIAIVMVLLAPASIGASVFLWQLHAESRALDDRLPKPTIRLSLVMALTGTFAAVSATLLAFAAALFLIGDTAASAALSPLILVAFVVLDLIPVVNAAYLRSLHPEAVPGLPNDLR